MWPVARRGLVYLPPLSKRTIFTRGQAQMHEEACASENKYLARNQWLGHEGSALLLTQR